MQIKIVLTDMPVPERGQFRARKATRGSKYPFAKLEPGRGFIVKCSADDKPTIARRLTSAMQAYRRTHEGNFTVRTLPDGVGIWAVREMQH